MTKVKIIKIIVSVLIAALTALGARGNRTEFVQRRPNHHEQVRVLPTRRYVGHDPDEDHRELRCDEKTLRRKG